MKKFLYKYGEVLIAIALFVTAYSSNRTCTYIFNQPKPPDVAKRFRKF